MVCLVKNDDKVLYSINLSTQEAEIQSKPLSVLFPGAATTATLSLEVVFGSVPCVAIVAGNVKQVVAVKNTGLAAVAKPVSSDSLLISAAIDKDNVLLQASLKDEVSDTF